MERLADSPDWAEYLAWWRRDREIVDNQERDKLNHEMPDDACRHVLAALPNRYRISEGWLRPARPEVSEPTYSAVEIFDRYGGSIMEDAEESGSSPLPSQ